MRTWKPGEATMVVSSPPMNRGRSFNGEDVMSVSKLRLDHYCSLATVPTLAAMAGVAVVSDNLSADIVHEDVTITVGGPGPAPFSTDLQIGTLGTFRILAGSNSKGPGRIFQMSNSSADKIRVMNEGEASKKGSGGLLSRFAAGDIVKMDKGRTFAKTGIGSQSPGSSKSGAPLGNFATNGEGPQSGYVGFGYLQAEGIGYGWISLTWDGSLLTIDGYAYETEAGTAIEAGAVPGPGAIGLFGLAAGAAGLRRKRQA